MCWWWWVITASCLLAAGQELEADELEWAAQLAVEVFVEEELLIDALDCCRKHEEEMLECAAQFAAVRPSRLLPPYAHAVGVVCCCCCCCFVEVVVVVVVVVGVVVVVVVVVGRCVGE